MKPCLQDGVRCCAIGVLYETAIRSILCACSIRVPSIVAALVVASTELEIHPAES